MFNKFKYIVRKNLYRAMQENDITYEELTQMSKDGAFILDVRSPQEYKEGHIAGAVLIPEYELKSRLNELPKDTESMIVVYCHSGARSRRAYNYLKSIGYKNVYNLFGGLQNL
jgi:rhodanese-related sulfurtransferase